MIPYLAYLSRPHPQDASQREWYPAGRLLAAALALWRRAAGARAAADRRQLRDPAAGHGRVLPALSTRAPELGLKSARRPADRSAGRAFVVAALPGALAAYWTAIFALNLYLGGRIARASGRLGRDWPDLPAMSLSAGLAAAGRAGALPPRSCRARSAWPAPASPAPCCFAYLIAGLALMHCIARGRGGPGSFGWSTPRSLLFGPYMAVLLTMAGLLEPALKLKRRFGAPPPAT